MMMTIAAETWVPGWTGVHGSSNGVKMSAKRQIPRRLETKTPFPPRKWRCLLFMFHIPGSWRNDFNEEKFHLASWLPNTSIESQRLGPTTWDRVLMWKKTLPRKKKKRRKIYVSERLTRKNRPAAFRLKSDHESITHDRTYFVRNTYLVKKESIVGFFVWCYSHNNAWSRAKRSSVVFVVSPRCRQEASSRWFDSICWECRLFVFIRWQSKFGCLRN